MNEIVYSAIPTIPAPVAVPQWWLYSAGHVLAGAMVVIDESTVEAQIQLDGVALYRSRHTSRADAEQELSLLRHQCAGDGWI